MSKTIFQIHRNDGTSFDIEKSDANLVYDFVQQQIHESFLRSLLTERYESEAEFEEKDKMIDEIIDNGLWEAYWSTYEDCIGEFGEIRCFEIACGTCADEIQKIEAKYRSKNKCE